MLSQILLKFVDIIRREMRDFPGTLGMENEAKQSRKKVLKMQRRMLCFQTRPMICITLDIELLCDMYRLGLNISDT